MGAGPVYKSTGICIESVVYCLVVFLNTNFNPLQTSNDFIEIASVLFQEGIGKWLCNTDESKVKYSLAAQFMELDKVRPPNLTANTKMLKVYSHGMGSHLPHSGKCIVQKIERAAVLLAMQIVMLKICYFCFIIFTKIEREECSG